MRHFAALFALLVLPGCLFDPNNPCDEPDPPPDCVGSPGTYPEKLDHPDSLLIQLRESYVRREIDRYAELLSHDFEFRFQDAEIPEFGESLGFEEDSTSTARMFSSIDVQYVRLSLTWGEPTTELLDGEDMQRVTLTDMLLDVELATGVTLRVQNQTQRYYFQWGREEMGEDPSRYYLRVWRDIGSSTGAPRTRDAAGAGPVVGTTWGGLRAVAGVEPGHEDR